MLHKFIFLFLFILVLGCSTTPLLEGFDSIAWKKDVEGCENLRTKLVNELIERRDELEGLGQKEILKILGKPNRHELYSRHKKAFVYIVAGSNACPEASANQSKLIIRFDALERTKEIVLYK